MAVDLLDEAERLKVGDHLVAELLADDVATDRGPVVGELEGGSRMVTVARWRNGAIAEEYIWM